MDLFSFIPQVIIILALVGIIVIVARKFPQLSAMKVQTKQRQKEQSIFSRSFKRITSFSVTIIRAIFARVVKIRDFKKDKQDKQIKEQEVGELISGRPIARPTVMTENNAFAKPVKNKFKQDEQNYLNLIQKNPKNTKAYIGLGKLYLAQKNFSDARASFEQVLKLNPNDFSAQAELKKIKR